MNTVSRSPSRTASRAATRPLIAAEPMFRAPRPEMVSESILTVWAFNCEADAEEQGSRDHASGSHGAPHFAGPAGAAGEGGRNRLSSSGTFASILS